MKCSQFPVLFALAFAVLSDSTYGGTIKYELPELLGQHHYDGSEQTPFGRVAHVNTSFGFYSIAEAKVVVEGSVTSGTAHGDGILREPLEFVLEPSVSAHPSFARSISFSTEPVIGAFRIEEVYSDPFWPEITPLPNPAGYPPVSFYVPFFVGLNEFSTDFPPRLKPAKPGELIFATDGMIVDEPIVANVTTAYILLSGPDIVPEPASGAIFVSVLVAGIFACRQRTRRRGGHAV